MNTEFYAMRLICEANGIDPSPWPEIASCQISDEDSRTSHDSMIYEAQNLVSDSKYQEAKDSINSHTSDCIAKVTDATIDSQNRAASVFDGIYGTIEACVAIYIALTLVICALVRRAIVKPLLSFGDSIKANQLFPVQGAGELQVLAETYNRVFTENEATHMVVKHQAEHDPLTDLLNRGSFDKALKLHDDGKHDFALILADVDQFKSVNDTFGHAVGDQVLKRVSSLLQVAFRSTDFVCRIGGDEFAVIMVDVTQRSAIHHPGEDRFREYGAIEAHRWHAAGIAERRASRSPIAPIPATAFTRMPTTRCTTRRKAGAAVAPFMVNSSV